MTVRAELDGQILDVEAWARIGHKGFDEPRHFAAYFNSLRWHCVTATDPKLFQAPFRAGIRIDAYQLEPLRKALLLPRVNLFIADDVGLGKTIEGLVVSAPALKDAQAVIDRARLGDLQRRFIEHISDQRLAGLAAGAAKPKGKPAAGAKRGRKPKSAPGIAPAQPELLPPSQGDLFA